MRRLMRSGSTQCPGRRTPSSAWQQAAALHPCRPCRPSLPICRPGRCQNASARRGEGFIGALQDSLRANVNPTPRRHLAVHDQAQTLKLAELFPGGPVAHQNWRWQSARVAQIRASGKLPRVFPDCTSRVSSFSRPFSAGARWRDINKPNCARPCPCRHR